MKIQLPLENWVDLLPYVPRRQLVEIVKQLGDRQFASILQFFLTEVGQIMLGHWRIFARILAQWDPNYYASNVIGPIVEVRMPGFFWYAHETIIPEGPMPSNVKDFKAIQLSYFDMSVAKFLYQFHKEEGNSLFDNVNLSFSSRIDNTVVQNVAQVMPLTGNINSMSMQSFACVEYGWNGREIEKQFSHQLKQMLPKTRVLDINGSMSKFSFHDWLYAPRNDGKPRALRLADSFPNTNHFIGLIKEDFSNAICPVSFFVYVRVKKYVSSLWQDDCLDSVRTNERLVIKTVDAPPVRNWFEDEFKKVVQISRYPMGATKEWIEANEKEIKEWDIAKQNRLILFESLK